MIQYFTTLDFYVSCQHTNPDWRQYLIVEYLYPYETKDLILHSSLKVSQNWMSRDTDTVLSTWMEFKNLKLVGLISSVIQFFSVWFRIMRQILKISRDFSKAVTLWSGERKNCGSEREWLNYGSMLNVVNISPYVSMYVELRLYRDCHVPHCV